MNQIDQNTNNANFQQPDLERKAAGGRTNYKSTFDARLNIPICAVITLDHRAKPANCQPPAPLTTPCTWDHVRVDGATGNLVGHILKRPIKRGHDFVTDLRQGVTPIEWNLVWKNSSDNDYNHCHDKTFTF